MKLLAASRLASILVSLTTFVFAADELTHIVQLKHGKVHGRVVTLEENKKVEFFEGIKYGNFGLALFFSKILITFDLFLFS